MSNIAGTHYALNVLTPIMSGREAILRRYLDDLPTGAHSPFAKLPQAHVGRWVIIPQLIYQGGGQKPDTLLSQYLLFTASFDGTPGRFVRDICTRMAEEADAIWSNCAGYPGTSDPAAFKRYIRHNQIPTGFFVSGYPDASVQDVTESLALRERFVAFAIDAQRLGAHELQHAFRDRVGPLVSR